MIMNRNVMRFVSVFVSVFVMLSDVRICSGY